MSLFTHGRKLLAKNGAQLARFSRTLHVSRMCCQAERKCEEVSIPMPWGHLAGKWWGPQDKRPVLCLHGWQESCSSYDPLLQLLPADTAFLAIDLPGHGYSSYLPKGMFYHSSAMLMLIRRIQKHYAWPAVSLLTHSMAGSFSVIFACLYPDDVDLLLQLDGIKPFSNTPGSGMEPMAANVDLFLRYDELKNSDAAPPTFTYDEAAQKLLDGVIFQDSVAPHSIKHVLDRTIGPAAQDPSRYVFRRDIRTKVDIFLRMQHEDICASMKKIKCPVLGIKYTKSSYYEEKRYVDDVLAILREHSKYLEILYIEGTHHAHVNSPEIVAPVVTEFLAKYGQQLQLPQKKVAT